MGIFASIIVVLSPFIILTMTYGLCRVADMMEGRCIKGTEAFILLFFIVGEFGGGAVLVYHTLIDQAVWFHGSFGTLTDTPAGNLALYWVAAVAVIMIGSYIIDMEVNSPESGANAFF